MAKDTRNHKGEQMASRQNGTTKKKRKKKKSAAKTVVLILLIAVAIVAVVFLVVLGKYLFELFTSDDNIPKPVPERLTTPSNTQDKVAYYLVGILGDTASGEDAADTDTQALSLVCYDKKADTCQWLQLPQDIYLGEDDNFAVKHLGGIWNKPQPLTWCETCRKRVYDPEVEGGKHTVCDTVLTEKTGSSVENLIDFFNEQLSMPIDGYFLLPQRALRDLVDNAGGVTVHLEKSLTVDDVKYPSGDQTLDGNAAVYYITDGKKDVATDLTRMLRQRQVLAALLSRLFQNDEETNRKLLTTVMDSRTPIRTEMSAKNMAALLTEWSKVGVAKMTLYIAPGEVAKSGSYTYYSLHTAELITLLNEQFNPYGRTITEADLRVDELKEPSAESDKKVATLDTCLAVQVKLETGDTGEEE